MTIHLISDRSSHLISDFLMEYCSGFFSDQIKFKQTKQSVDYQSYWDWNKLFSVGNEVKSNQKTGSSYEFFVVLAKENEQNWFASFDTKNPSVGFLQTTGWEKYGLNNPQYAIAYHLLGLVTIMRFLGQEPNPLSFFHGKSKGCMFDFTDFKEEVIFKLKSAHICPTCIESIAKRSAGNPNLFSFFKSVKDLMENVRDNLFSVEWNRFFDEFDYQLIVNEDLTMDLKINQEQISLPISKGREAALYMTILNHENGVSYQDFEKPQLKKEYLRLYHRYFVRNATLEALIKQADAEIQQKTYKSNLLSTISKIRQKLNKTLKQYPEIQKQLQIQSGVGRITIPMNREKLICRLT